MPDEKPGTEDGRKTERSVGREPPRSDDRIVDGRLDPDAQSPDDERAKPFDPKENDPA